VLTSHPRSAARKCSAEKPHSSIQVVPITRPSLRSGLTAYAVLSREPNSFWPPSPRRLAMWLIRLDAPHLRERLDRSDDGQDHTVLPYARFASSPQSSSALSTLPKNCWRDEPDSAARRRAVSGSQGLPAPPDLSRPTLPASTASPARENDDTRSPLKDEPGWATYTSFPNFGKVEYFCGEGLTGVAKQGRLATKVGSNVPLLHIKKILDLIQRNGNTAIARPNVKIKLTFTL